MIRNSIQSLLVASALFTSFASVAAQANGQIAPQGDDHEIRMSCDFNGNFGDGKSGGGFAMFCHAKAKFEMVDDHDFHWHMNSNNKAFEVTCDDQDGGDRDRRGDHGSIYQGHLSYGLRPQSGGPHGQVDAIFTGDETISPTVIVQNVNAHHLAGDRAGASLNFRHNGWEYTLFGECRFSDRRDQDPLSK